MERYESLGLVGEGSYGTVLKCRHKESGRLVAIKKFMDSDDDKTVKKIALREIKLLRQLRHDNLVNLLEVWKRRRRWYLVFEFVERTLLDDLEQKPNGLDLNTSRQHLYQILRAVAFCHQQNIIHRDIKPENILISQGDVVKLCDFGFARTMATPADGGAYTDYVATRWYRAPELLVGDTKYGKPVDVWAVGCLLLEMLTGQPLFPGDSDLDQIYHIVRCFGNLTAHHQELFYRNPVFSGVRLPQCSSKVPLEHRFPSVATNALDVAQSCLQMDPESRAHCSELLEHALFTQDSFNIRFLEDLNAKIQKDHRENSTLPKIAKTQGRDEDNVNDKDQRRKDKKQSEDMEVKVKKEKEKGDKDDKDKFTKTKAKQPPKPKHIHDTPGPSMSNKQSKTQCTEKMAKVDRSHIITRDKPGKASGVELKMEPGISIPSKTYTPESLEASKTAPYLNKTADIKHRNGEVASVEPRERKMKQADTKEIGFTGVLSSYSDNSVPRVAEKSMKEIQIQSKVEPVQDSRKSKNSNAKAAKISNCSTPNHLTKKSSKPPLGSIFSCSESKSTQKMSKISPCENPDRTGTATSCKVSDTDRKSISTKVVKVSTPVIPSVTKQHKTITSKHQRDCSDMDTEQRSTCESVKVLPPTTKSFTTISKSGFRNTKENTNVPDSPLKNLTTDPSVQSSVVFIEGNLAHSVTSITGSSLNAKPPNTAIWGLDKSQTDLQANRDLEILITTASQQESTTSREDIRENCGWSPMSSVINTAAKPNETDDVLSVDYEENPGYNGSSGIHQQSTTKCKITKESRTSTSTLDGITKYKTPVGIFVPKTLKAADKENREDLALLETISPTTQSPQADPQALNPKQTENNMKFLHSPHIEFLTREPKAKHGSFGKPTKSPMTVTTKTQKPTFPTEAKNKRDDTEGDRGLNGPASLDSTLFISSANPDHNDTGQILYDIHTENANDCTFSASYSPPPPPPPPSSTPQLLPLPSTPLIPSISAVGTSNPNSSNQFTVGMGLQSGTINLRCSDKPKYQSGIYSRLTYQAVTGPQTNQMPENSPICEHSFLSERCNLGNSSGGPVPRKKSDIYFPDVRHSVLPELKGRDGKQHTKGPSKDQRKDKQPVQAVHPSDQQKLGSNSTDTKTH